MYPTHFQHALYNNNYYYYYHNYYYTVRYSCGLPPHSADIFCSIIDSTVLGPPNSKERSLRVLRGLVSTRPPWGSVLVRSKLLNCKGRKTRWTRQATVRPGHSTRCLKSSNWPDRDTGVANRLLLFVRWSSVATFSK